MEPERPMNGFSAPESEVRATMLGPGLRESTQARRKSNTPRPGCDLAPHPATGRLGETRASPGAHGRALLGPDRHASIGRRVLRPPGGRPSVRSAPGAIRLPMVGFVQGSPLQASRGPDRTSRCAMDRRIPTRGGQRGAPALSLSPIFGAAPKNTLGMGSLKGRPFFPHQATPPPHSLVERTLVLLKPDAVQRGLVGRILGRFEEKGLKLVGLKMRTFPTDLLEQHYDVHRERPFFANLVKFMSSGPAVALCLEGKDAIAVVRRLVGKTNSREADPGTIRGDFGMSFSNNLVHASDGPDTAASELALWFSDSAELSDWEPADLGWTYNVAEELS
jgi:nucleoside-diphosphate kinase